MIKQAIKSVLHRFGVDVIRYQEPIPELYRPFSILNLLIDQRAANGDPCFFVQVGANDGVMADPLRPLILKHRMAGLLIEPLPDLFEQLKTNYATQPQLKFENVAISSEPATVAMYRVRAGVPALNTGLASFNREHLVNCKIPDEYIEIVHVSSVTLPSLLKKHSIEKVNLLQIDTEGYDFEIIKSAFNSGIYPDIINYEHRHIGRANKYHCKKMLDDLGYQFIEASFEDTIALRIRS